MSSNNPATGKTTKSEAVCCLIEPSLKVDATAVLDKLGLGMSDAIRIFLPQGKAQLPSLYEHSSERSFF